ncbi:putative nuclease HARBI1, partial [Neolecta irregularis DAH-3]
ERFQHSGQTISKYFLKVLHSLLKLYPEVVQLPDPNIIPEEILKNLKFYPFFKNCIGAADGCHILSKVSSDDSARFHNRKGEISQNFLGICKFNLQFCYVLSGWEGSAHDGLVLQYALSAGGGLTIPDGKYYLVDAAYALKKAPVQAQIVTALAALHNFISVNSGRDEIEDWDNGVQISDNEPEHSLGRVYHSEDDREMSIIQEEIAVSMWEDYENTQR